MYRQIAKWLVHHLKVYNTSLSEETLQEIFIYGVEITLSTIVSYGLVLLEGFLLGAWQCAVIFEIVFTSIRLYMGGYHCTSYLSCNLTFCGIYGLIYLLAKCLAQSTNTFSIISIILLWSGLGIWTMQPIGNKHKPISKAQKQQCHRIAKALFLADAAIAIFLYLLASIYGITVAMSLGIAVLLIPIGKWSERRRYHHEAEGKVCKNCD